MSTALEFLPLAPSFGVEVKGLDLTATPEPATAEALRAAFRQHRLLLLRAGSVTPAEQARFGEIFGRIELREMNRVKPKDDHSLHVSNVLPDGLFGDVELAFHLDHLFFPDPTQGLILCAVEVPERGGETAFCDTEAVFEAMPAALRAKLESLRCRTLRGYDADVAKRYNVEETGDRVFAIHPLVWRDPETGRRALWVNRRWTTEVVGLPPAESQALLTEVRRYIETATATWTHAWKPGDLILWNNQLLQHARRPFDPAARRTLRRTPLVAA